MRSLVMLMAVLTASCASVADIREKPVVAAFGSQRSVAEISSCLTVLLSERSGAKIRTVPIEHGVTIAEYAPVNMGSTVFTTTDIEDKTSQRVVTIRSVANYKPVEKEKLSARYHTCL